MQIDESYQSQLIIKLKKVTIFHFVLDYNVNSANILSIQRREEHFNNLLHLLYGKNIDTTTINTPKVNFEP